MADISTIQLPDGNSYTVKDQNLTEKFFEIIEDEISTTTSAGGNAQLGLAPRENTILSASLPTLNNYLVTPFVANANTLSVHIADLSGNPLASTAVLVRVAYLKRKVPPL